MASHVEAERAVSRFRETHSQPDEERFASHQHSVRGVDRCRADPHENLNFARLRLRHVCQLEHLGPAVAAIDQRLHCTRLLSRPYFVSRIELRDAIYRFEAALRRFRVSKGDFRKNELRDTWSRGR